MMDCASFKNLQVHQGFKYIISLYLVWENKALSVPGSLNKSKLNFYKATPERRRGPEKLSLHSGQQGPRKQGLKHIFFENQIKSLQC